MTAANRMRAIVLIDGEHQPAVVADALAQLSVEHEIAGVAFLGGEEKVSSAVLENPATVYGYDLVRGETPLAALRTALATIPADVAIDLSDEPIADASESLRLAGVVLAAGLSYRAPGMELSALRPSNSSFAGPKIAVVGTAKRTGKTAVCGHLAQLMVGAGASPAIVSMGRGGPAEPQLAIPPIGIEQLLELAAGGAHAASDYLEDATLANVPTVGCRRVGGGVSGATHQTNFAAGAELAAAIADVDALLFEGSGATIPPVLADATITIAGDVEQAQRGIGPARVAAADLVLVRGATDDEVAQVRTMTEAVVSSFRMVSAPAVMPPAGARVAAFTTGATELDGLEPLLMSSNLARRDALEDDLGNAERAGCDHFLVEIKAAAIDTVARRATEIGASIGFIGNRPVSDVADLDHLLLNVWQEAAR
ncbi:MAG: hypothetical protein ACPGWS_03805 [Solirubrobacterales bacterium]